MLAIVNKVVGVFRSVVTGGGCVLRKQKERISLVRKMGEEGADAEIFGVVGEGLVGEDNSLLWKRKVRRKALLKKAGGRPREHWVLSWGKRGMRIVAVGGERSATIVG